MDYLDYIRPELLVLIFALAFFGMGLKHSTVADKWIPLILGGGGILLATAYVLGTSVIATGQDWIMAVFTGITQGILCAGAAVYGHQIIKQAGKDD